VSPTFFTDRDLGTRFPDILRNAGLSVERHRDHFLPNAADEQWLELVGTKKWIAVTHDARIRYKPNELDAVIRHGVGLLILIGAAPFSALAANFVMTLPRILAFLRAHEPPFIAKVYRPTPAELVRNRDARGTVSLWYPTP
jgi:predicted nuclease of predicted toxin-antitoxin system